MTDRDEEAWCAADPEKLSCRLPLYTRERAERLVRLNRALWEELRACAAVLVGTLHRDPQFGAWRARVRMLGAILADLTPEFEQSLEARLELRDRDEDESFRILGALQEAVQHLLQRIEDDREDFEEYVVEALGEDLDEGLGTGFLSTLERFKVSFRHHEVAWSLLDSIDVQSVGADEGPAAVDRKIERLERGLAERGGSVRTCGPG